MYGVHMSRPTTPLTRDRVLDAAWEQLQETGIAGLSMRTISQRLGVVPMALYRHVSDKDDLLDGLLDRMTSAIPVPVDDVAPRAAIEAVARGILDEVVAQPALVTALVLRPSWTSSAQALGERAVSAFVELGLSPAEAVRAWNAVSMYAVGFAVFAAPRRADGEFAGSLGSFVERSAPEDGSLVAQAGVDRTEWVSDEQFDHGLAALLDGLLPAGARRRRR